MRLLSVLIAIVFEFIQVENRMLPNKQATLKFTPMDMPEHDTTFSVDGSSIDAVLKEDDVVADSRHLRDEILNHEKVIGLKINDEKESEEDTEYDKKHTGDKGKEPCAIVVLSNIQNPNMQSLIRKYRYDASGALIPSSVKYFMKLPQGLGLSPVLVPLNDKAFSPLGGFVRYYKEVPPIPHSW